MRARFSLRAPPGFELGLVARSHGWYGLPPLQWDADAGALRFAVALDEATAVAVAVRQQGDALRGEVEARDGLSPARTRQAARAAAWCLRLDEDLAEFHELARGDERIAWAAERGAGRILRAPTPFEDLIKILCTTNCSWALTEVMVGNLVARLGLAAPGARAFPTPAAMARRREAFYRARIRAGYRAPHFPRLARMVVRGELRPDAWAREPDTAALRKQLLALPGIGPYAAAHLLRLSGHYADAGIDSWVRGTFQRIYALARPPSDARIHRRYARFGRWLGLALWMDVTRDWHVRE